MTQPIYTGLLACVGFAAIANLVIAEQPDSLGSRQILPVVAMKSMPAKGTWISQSQKLSGDGDATGSMETGIVLQAEGNRLKGYSYRNQAVKFTGEFIQGTPPIITLRRDQKDGNTDGYTTIYTGKLVAPNRFVGSWLDNRGVSSIWVFKLESDILDKALPGSGTSQSYSSDAASRNKKVIGPRLPETVRLPWFSQPAKLTKEDILSDLSQSRNSDRSVTSQTASSDIVSLIDESSLPVKTSAIDLLPLALARMEVLRELTIAETEASSADDRSTHKHDSGKHNTSKKQISWMRNKLQILDAIAKAEKQSTEARIAAIKARDKRRELDEEVRVSLEIQLLNAKNRLHILELLTNK